MKHDFKAPLLSMLSLLENLLDSLTDKAMRRIVSLVIFQINIQLCRVGNILDLKLLEEGKFEISGELFSLVDTFKSVLDLFKQQADFYNTKL